MIRVVAAAILSSVTAAQALECHDSGRAWREIDGRRCWFDGPRRLPKAELHWPVAFHVKQAADIDAPAASAPQPPEPHITVLKVRQGAPTPAASSPSFYERWHPVTTIEELK